MGSIPIEDSDFFIVPHSWQMYIASLSWVTLLIKMLKYLLLECKATTNLHYAALRHIFKSVSLLVWFLYHEVTGNNAVAFTDTLDIILINERHYEIEGSCQRTTQPKPGCFPSTIHCIYRKIPVISPPPPPPPPLISSPSYRPIYLETIKYIRL